MDHSRAILTLTALLATIACGPPRLGSGTTDDETSSGEGTADTSSSSSTNTESPDTESPDTETSDTETSTTIDFVPPYDHTEPAQCDPWSQDCPDGEKCVPFSTNGGTWDANKCVPILGEQAPGEPCTWGGISEATDDCDGTGACFNTSEVDGEQIGTCHAFCTGTPDVPECPEGSSCKLSGDGSLTFCIPTCDPLVQDCEPGLACYWAGNEFNCVFTTQDIPAGEPCSFINDCALGHICLDGAAFPACEGAACCSVFCDLELGDAQCDVVPGTSCVAFFEEGTEPPGYENVGICVVP